MIMRHLYIYIISIAIAALTASCNDDELLLEQNSGAESGSHLQFSVCSFSVNGGQESRSAEPSENPEPDNEKEKRIRDFWLFQFNPDGTQLAAPAYYSIPADGSTLNELTAKAYQNLTKNTPMTIYVVTNTGNPALVTGNGFDTLDKVKEQKLARPAFIQAGEDNDGDGIADDLYIPMSGMTTGTVTVTDKSLIVVPVTRMYAKIKIQANFPETDMVLYYANITGIPWYCKFSPLANTVDPNNGERVAVQFPEGTNMTSRALSSNDAVTDRNGKKWLVIYIPENIRGEIDDADKTAAQNIPDNALTVKISAKYKGEDFFYTVYPGENKVNNFNIRRNCVYRVTVDVLNATDQHNPSSNCYVVKPHGELAFEPYNRAETGGGYSIRTYLDPSVPDKTINRLAIIWQTKNCIGDNTNGDLVSLGPETENPVNRKIYVKTGEEGNALIGAYNSKNEIIWSWHIWVTPNEPDNLANAITYTTYRWDYNKIYTQEPRVPGYGIMPCNIGALDFRSGDMTKYSVNPGEKFPDDQIRTFGMLYQWGRKDPFPPMIYSTGTEDSNGFLAYNDDYTGDHYANDNRTLVHKTNDNSNSYLFHTQLNTGISNISTVNYGVAHPTVYISGYRNLWGFGEYNNDGDWCKEGESDDRLWGAAEKTGSSLSIDGGKAHLYNNYGTKSIFDPCPNGWRVPPPDLWLGFSKTGVNPTDYTEVNFCEAESGKRPGLSMYVRAFGYGPTVYFPLQGVRLQTGRCKNTGLCGNYHNATCDVNNRVNILHLHRDMTKASDGYGHLLLFMIFEYQTEAYYAKSTAGPIRCVRDSK